MSPEKAFILAAGFGKRLRPYTENIPKPMVKVNETPMIDHALKKLVETGVKECVINTHYKAEILSKHLQTLTNPEIKIYHEPEILDTGGGIHNAIENFPNPFFVLSGDSVWEDSSEENTLKALAQAWSPDKMDILILLQPVETMTLTHGVGDYDLNENAQAIRSKNQSGRYMWTSIRINAPEIFNDAPHEPFSYLQLLDKAQAKGRLYGHIHKGDWHHISTPEDLESVNFAYEKRTRRA